MELLSAVHPATVWLADVAATRPDLLRLLDPGERARWSALRDPRDRDRYVVAHALARVLLGGLTGTEPAQLGFAATCHWCGGPHGKPRLRAAGGHRFSLTHSGRLVAVAVTREVEVGVDIEEIALRGTGLPLTVLSTVEQEALATVPGPERLPAFIRYWTRKEAVLKATGHGLGLAPARLTVTPPWQPPALLAWSGGPRIPVHLYDLTVPDGYRGCLASVGTPLAVSMRDGTGLLAGPLNRAAHRVGADENDERQGAEHVH
ncbi:MAG TPA: 4'-phosphopantetheinyl transferase superfamily protein [Rugosimonospora sp.]|nr:4'-phosphopantetheinyl transferase superfamily protein [Rugosimonospora sp.]